MARNKANQKNIDNSNPTDYPNARIKNNTGAGDGTSVNEAVYGDIHEFMAKLMRLYGISYNGLPDNESNGYQYIEALRALASKNDFILSINTSNSKLTVPVKLSSMLANEQIVCKASITKTNETQITGSDGISRAVSYIGDFKAGEYVRLINTSSTVVLIRMVDSVNLDLAVTELGFLKAASNAEELDGIINTKATTPLSNALAFVERVNGSESSNSLAIAAVRNGLLSKEDKEKIDNFTDVTSLIKVESASDVQVTAWEGGAKQNNFNFNYVDVFPPSGKTMANLSGFIASYSNNYQSGDSPDDTWCKWQVLTSKIRVICGTDQGQQIPSVNWLAIWI